jgi:hypothetical protein
MDNALLPMRPEVRKALPRFQAALRRALPGFLYRQRTHVGATRFSSSPNGAIGIDFGRRARGLADCFKIAASSQKRECKRLVICNVPRPGLFEDEVERDLWRVLLMDHEVCLVTPDGLAVVENVGQLYGTVVKLHRLQHRLDRQIRDQARLVDADPHSVRLGTGQLKRLLWVARRCHPSGFKRPEKSPVPEEAFDLLSQAYGTDGWRCKSHRGCDARVWVEDALTASGPTPHYAIELQVSEDSSGVPTRRSADEQGYTLPPTLEGLAQLRELLPEDVGCPESKGVLDLPSRFGLIAGFAERLAKEGGDQGVLPRKVATLLAQLPYPPRTKSLEQRSASRDAYLRAWGALAKVNTNYALSWLSHEAREESDYSETRLWQAIVGAGPKARATLHILADEALERGLSFQYAAIAEAMVDCGLRDETTGKILLELLMRCPRGPAGRRLDTRMRVAGALARFYMDAQR